MVDPKPAASKKTEDVRTQDPKHRLRCMCLISISSGFLNSPPSHTGRPGTRPVGPWVVRPSPSEPKTARRHAVPHGSVRKTPGTYGLNEKKNLRLQSGAWKKQVDRI